MSQQTTNHSFDELTRGLANGTLSRGKALRLMGAALVGGALASIPGIALAEPKLKPDGAKCKRDSQCQSGQCASPESGGVCLPPRGPTFLQCSCRDGTTVEGCISTPCSDTLGTCTTLCRKHRGSGSSLCDVNGCVA